jgi:hypothetical protein
VYRVTTYGKALEQITALPDEALNGYADVLSVLELAPWSGQPQHEGNPDGAVRR